ncbi:MAG: glycosyltransferase family 4 protein [Pyrinomonadaceae bacterium]
MRIAVWHNLPSGGAKRALYDHVRGLVGRGHTVEAWCPPTASRTYLPLSDLIPEHVVPTVARPERASPAFFDLLTLRTYNLDKWREVDEYARQCAAEINRGGFDLLFANSSIEMAVSSIGRYVHLPSVLYLQEPSRWLYEAQPRLIWAGRCESAHWWTPAALNHALREAIRLRGYRIYARAEWRNARAFDQLLVNSHFSRESVLRTYGVDARVCYLGVDTEKFTWRDLPKENYVVGVGAIAPRKNVRLVIEALARVPAPRPRLVWIGDVARTEYVAELEQLAHATGVEFTPLVQVDDEALIDTLNRALLMVYTPRLEPFGFAPLEANACGLPVVAVAEGGVRETIRDGVNGLLVEHDPQAVADAIAYLLQHPTEAARMGQHARQLVVENWSVIAAIDRLEQNLIRVLPAAHERRPEN